MKKKKLRKVRLCLRIGCSIKPFEMIINLFFFLIRKHIRIAVFAFCYQDNERNIKRENWERQIARNGKLQHLFQNLISIV